VGHGWIGILKDAEPTLVRLSHPCLASKFHRETDILQEYSFPLSSSKRLLKALASGNGNTIGVAARVMPQAYRSLFIRRDISFHSNTPSRDHTRPTNQPKVDNLQLQHHIFIL
jgi:hypothetical protein